jgi:hypothetical protein
VTHLPGADTLAIAFEGGGTFASVIDGKRSSRRRS